MHFLLIQTKTSHRSSFVMNLVGKTTWILMSCCMGIPLNWHMRLLERCCTRLLGRCCMRMLLLSCNSTSIMSGCSPASCWSPFSWCSTFNWSTSNLSTMSWRLISATLLTNTIKLVGFSKAPSLLVDHIYLSFAASPGL